MLQSNLCATISPLIIFVTINNDQSMPHLHASENTDQLCSAFLYIIAFGRKPHQRVPSVSKS